MTPGHDAHKLRLVCDALRTNLGTLAPLDSEGDASTRPPTYAKHHGRNQVCSEADRVRRGLLTVEAKVGDIELF